MRRERVPARAKAKAVAGAELGAKGDGWYGPWCWYWLPPVGSGRVGLRACGRERLTRCEAKLGAVLRALRIRMASHWESVCARGTSTDTTSVGSRLVALVRSHQAILIGSSHSDASLLLLLSELSKPDMVAEGEVVDPLHNGIV